jgi:cysteine desulfurase
MTTRMPRKCIVTSTVEHSAIREPLGVLAKLGIAVEKIRVNRGGELDMGMLEEVLTRRGAEGPDGVSLVTMIWANNETGVMFDVVKVGELCRRFGVPLHVDGVQAVGKVRMKVSEMPVDVMSVSGHKFHGPKGVGALYVRRGVRWNPWVRGGPQELDRRGGTENVAGIVGMGLAAEMASKCLGDGTWERIGGLRDRLEAGILKRVEDAHVIGDAKRRAGNTTNVAFAGLEAEAILLLLSEREICASAGAACSSGSLEPSPVLRAMGVDDRIGHGAVRFSLSRFTTEAEVDEVLEVLPGVIRKLRATLPV